MFRLGIVRAVFLAAMGVIVWQVNAGALQAKESESTPRFSVRSMLFCCALFHFLTLAASR